MIGSEEIRKPSDIEVVATEGRNIALQLQPGLKWFDGVPRAKDNVSMLKLNYCAVGYFGITRSEGVGESLIITLPRKHHRVLTGMVPTGAPKHLIEAFPLILHHAALDLGAPDQDGLILEQMTPMTDLQITRLRQGAHETNAFCQWSLMWLEPGESW